MRHQLAFTELVNYDAGQPSITVPITLSVSQARVDCDATVTGNFVAYLHEVNLSLASLEFSGLIGFAEDKEFRRNVLGRRGFIEQMTLGLVDYEGKLYLGRYDE